MSLDLNLFFLRIMKEHAFFLEIGFTPRDSELAARVGELKRGFEALLSEAVEIACGNVSRRAVSSRQFVTRFTADAEGLTRFYTGLPFNIELTRREMQMEPGGDNGDREGAERVDTLNRRARELTERLIRFKEKLLADVLSCRVFVFNYPLLIKHILREARLYLMMLDELYGSRRSLCEDLVLQETFWNRQMAEHAKFIAGLLDPTEEDLIKAARMFGREFDALTAESRKANCRDGSVGESTRDSVQATLRLKEFKTAATQGLLSCDIKSIIIPLLGDHVLREANHFLCVMGVCNTGNTGNAGKIGNEEDAYRTGDTDNK